jgi:hypothetical protein
MNLPPLQPCPAPSRPHTEPVSREETLARREKFQKIGWFAPNHKPKTKEVIATAKMLWGTWGRTKIASVLALGELKSQVNLGQVVPEC